MTPFSILKRSFLQFVVIKYTIGVSLFEEACVDGSQVIAKNASLLRYPSA